MNEWEREEMKEKTHKLNVIDGQNQVSFTVVMDMPPTRSINEKIYILSNMRHMS